MVDIAENNNGNVLICIIILCDSIAQENNSAVVVETHHQEGCTLMDQTKKQQWLEELDSPDPRSKEAMAHLYFCNCDTIIEIIFCKPDGETLWVPFLLSDIKRNHPWMNDDETTKKILAAARSLGPESMLLAEMKDLFQKHVGRHYMPGFSPHTSPGTIH